VSLFKRRSGAPEDTITPFWDWWSAEGRDLAEQSIDGRIDPATFAEPMNERLHQVGELSWQLAAGETSERVLVVSPGGDPALRALARRVLLGGPEPDDAWSYVDTRPPVPDPESVVLGGEVHLDLAQVRVSARMDEGRLDVQLHHPAFADLPEETRAQVTFLALDAALGEVDTELWLGEVQPVELPPLDGFGLTALRSVVQDLKRQRLDADGQPAWVMLRGETAEGPLQAMVRFPLHPLTAPNLDTYVAVAVPYRDQANGLPGSEALDTLRTLEHRLAARLGNDGQVVAHLSTGGVRTLHLYVDSTADVLPMIKEVARTWDQGKASVHDLHDPAWQAVAHLRQ
jgi:Family of unknown function (DUF695)